MGGVTGAARTPFFLRSRGVQQGAQGLRAAFDHPRNIAQQRVVNLRRGQRAFQQRVCHFRVKLQHLGERLTRDFAVQQAGLHKPAKQARPQRVVRRGGLPGTRGDGGEYLTA